MFLSNNLERILFLSCDQSERKTFYKMDDADDFARGETLYIFFRMLDASELDHLFEEEMYSIRVEVV